MRAASVVAVGAFLALVVSGTVSCGERDRGAPGSAAGAPGVAAPAPPEGPTPRRIVALTCGAVDILTALGELDRVVAVEEDCPAPGTEGKVKIRNDDHPGKVQAINVESVVALRPDAVIAKPDLRNALEGRGLRVLWAPEYVDMGNLPGHVEDIGALVGEPGKARALIERMRSKVDEIGKRTAGLPKVRVYYETTGLGRTSGRRSVIDAMIRLAGGVNIAGDLDQPNVALSGEAVLAADPEVIVLGAFADAPEDVVRRPGWDRLSAVRNGRVHRIPVERRWVMLPTPRCVDGCEEFLLPWLHPELATGAKER